MKKIITILGLVLLTGITIAFNYSQEIGEYKLLKVVDGDTFYIDFNKNNYPDKDEKVRINGIDTFETKINDGLFYQMKFNNLTLKEALGMGYFATEFAKKQLLNKNVAVEYSAEDKFDKYNRKLVSIYYDCKKNPSLRPGGISLLNLVPRSEYCTNYEQKILSEGLANVYNKSNRAQYLKQFENKEKMRKNIKKTKKLNLVFYDFIEKKYHKIDCKDVKDTATVVLTNKKMRGSVLDCKKD